MYQKFVYFGICKSNGIIAIIALRDLDLLFKVKYCYISETIRGSANICGRHVYILTFFPSNGVIMKIAHSDPGLHFIKQYAQAQKMYERHL